MKRIASARKLFSAKGMNKLSESRFLKAQNDFPPDRDVRIRRSPQAKNSRNWRLKYIRLKVVDRLLLTISLQRRRNMYIARIRKGRPRQAKTKVIYSLMYLPFPYFPVIPWWSLPGHAVYGKYIQKNQEIKVDTQKLQTVFLTHQVDSEDENNPARIEIVVSIILRVSDIHVQLSNEIGK